MNLIGRRQQDDEDDDILGIANQKPGKYGADQATDVLDQPDLMSLTRPRYSESLPEGSAVHEDHAIIVDRIRLCSADGPNYGTACLGRVIPVGTYNWL